MNETRWVRSPIAGARQEPIEGAPPELLRQHSLRVPQVAQLEAFREPGDQRLQERLGLGAPALCHPQPCEARGRTQLVKVGLEASRQVERLAVAGLRLRPGLLGAAPRAEQIAARHVQLDQMEALAR